MPATLEREIKLPFASPLAARAAVVATGARPLNERRLQQDSLLDTAEGQLRREQSVLRLRTESGKALLTFKGPVLPAAMKLREEIETPVGDRALMLEVFGRLGFRVWFRYEKYREEFELGNVTLSVDETPVGVFVELEGDEDEITAIAATLGYGPEGYVLESYRSLFARRCAQLGIPVTDMLFSHD